VGAPVGRLGAGQVAPEAAELAELVVALGGAGDVQVGQLQADQGGLPLGLGPGALAGHDLGAVDPADAGEQHGRRQAGQPAAGRLRPLGRPADVGQLVEGGHQVAVDVAGPLRAQLAREHGQHGLVQLGHPLGHAALLDQPPPLEHVADGDQAGVGVPAADVPDPPGRGHDRVLVAAGQGTLQVQVEEVAVLGLLRLVAEQPPGPAQPARPDHAVAAEEGVDRDPDGGHGRRPGSALVQVAPVGPLEQGRRLVEVAPPPGGVGPLLQVVHRTLASRVTQVTRTSLPSLPPAAKRS
jgi:hypothetical protein